MLGQKGLQRSHAAPAFLAGTRLGSQGTDGGAAGLDGLRQATIGEPFAVADDHSGPLGLARLRLGIPL